LRSEDAPSKEWENGRYIEVLVVKRGDTSSNVRNNGSIVVFQANSSEQSSIGHFPILSTTFWSGMPLIELLDVTNRIAEMEKLAVPFPVRRVDEP
jgi:hypothetical protein